MIKHIETYFGIIENVDDPDKLGRYQVRIYYLHTTNKSFIPTESLFWSMVLLSPTSSSTKGVGISPTGLEVGSNVIGFFLDGENKQEFFIIGTYPSMTDNENDVNIIARGEGNEHSTIQAKKDLISKGVNHKVIDHNKIVYPNSQVIESRSGHVLIYDDSDGVEKIEIIHKTGTSVGMHEDGSIQIASNNSYEIIDGNKNKTITGSEKDDIGGNLEINVEGNIDITATGNITLKGKTINLN